MSRLAKQPAFGNAATQGATPRRPANQGNCPAGSNISCGRGERSRHVALREKCFRCAKSDHMIPQCSYPKTVKCNTHKSYYTSLRMSAKCSARLACTASFFHLSCSTFNAISYRLRWWLFFLRRWIFRLSPASFCILLRLRFHARWSFYTPTNQPTPEMLL